jgi:hypothetical protein
MIKEKILNPDPARNRNPTRCGRLGATFISE